MICTGRTACLGASSLTTVRIVHGMSDLEELSGACLTVPVDRDHEARQPCVTEKHDRYANGNDNLMPSRMPRGNRFLSYG
jgi:hypothetical protein